MYVGRFVVVAPGIGGYRVSSRSFPNRRVREFYGVTDRELAATNGDLADVVRERAALLDVEK